MTNLDSSSQWHNVLRNLGEWHGSFTRFDADGQQIEGIPTIVTLTGHDHQQTIRQTVEYFSATGELTQRKELEYSSLNRSTLVFPDGAFSQGSMQFSPFGDFGAEFGFLGGDPRYSPTPERRLRLVQVFQPVDGVSCLSNMTLIREALKGSTVPERPALTPAMLQGTWRGEAMTLYPDWRSPEHYDTVLTIDLKGDRLFQTLTAPGFELTSSALIQGSTLLFDQGTYPVRVFLLPDGASSNTPVTIPRGRSFVLEAGWLPEPNRRQRLIRRYDEHGGWLSLTLITEQRDEG